MLRISTVVDLHFDLLILVSFGSAKNFYCCRYQITGEKTKPLEVLRISTVVDLSPFVKDHPPLEVLRISTVVDLLRALLA